MRDVRQFSQSAPGGQARLGPTGGPSLAINTWIPFKEAPAFTPWWVLHYIWCDTGVFLLVFFLLIFRRLLEPQTGVVGAQSLRIVSVLWFCTVQDSFVCMVVGEFRGLVSMIHVDWSM